MTSPVNIKVLYTAQYPVNRTAQSALRTTRWQTCSLHHQLDFSHAANTVQRLFFYIYPPLFVARYSFIQLSELEESGVNEIAQASKRQQMASRQCGGLASSPGHLN